jgi:rhamnogalacturonyl hydrolase YesR
MSTIDDFVHRSLRFLPTVPGSEFNMTFAQGMADRMSMSYAKYGPVAQAYPDRVDAIASLKKRLERYEETGNTEYLMDVANFAMIEFQHPRHSKAHFKAEDSKASPGRQWVGEVDPSQRSNRIEKVHR